MPGLRGPRAPGGVDQGQAVSGWRGSGAQAQAGGWGLDRHCMCCQGPGRGQHGHLPPQPGVTQGRPHSHPASFLIITQLSLFFVRYNLHDLKLTTLKSTLRWHLAQASPQSSSRTFHLPKGDPIAISRHSPSTPLPWRPPTCFLSQQMHLMSQSFTQAPHGPLCLAPFSQRALWASAWWQVSEPHFSKCPRDQPRFASSPVDGYLGGLRLWATVNLLAFVSSVWPAPASAST